MIEYESKLIHEFAERLYKRAKDTEITYTVGGLVLGLLVGGFGDYLRFGSTVIKVDYLAVAGVVAGAVLGYLAGVAKAFELRLQAQTALCQVKIEENTRPKSPA